jgi:predicted nuclease with TOPRIM domain
VPDPIEDLRSTEESMREDAETVKSMEREKSELDPRDPRVGEMSDRIKDKTAELDDKAAAEQSLSAQVRREA